MKQSSLMPKENKSIAVNYSETDSLSDFSVEKQKLIEQTIAFADNAYAPYSEFHVSAGLILDNGETVMGTNVENGSYPVSICAERTLLSHAVSNYPDNIIQTIAIYVDKAVGRAIPPCGLCRQTLLEVELRQKSNIEIILVSKEGTYLTFNKAADLLPLYFDGSVL